MENEPEAVSTETQLTVRSTDMDADRNVNNAAYFTYFEQSRLEHLLRLGVIRWPPGPADRSQFALAETSARFRAPAYHRDVLTIRTRTIEVRQRSFSLGYQVLREKDSALICEGSSAQVWLDEQGRAAGLPETVRAALVASMGHVDLVSSQPAGDATSG
ncbi:MAG: acyl-CoA thioesterase [Dehalococcoidia bacterium]